MRRTVFRILSFSVIAFGGYAVTSPTPALAMRDSGCGWCVTEGYTLPGCTTCDCGTSPIKWCTYACGSNTCPVT